MRKYKNIMELIFIFIIPLIYIMTCVSIKEKYTQEQQNSNINYENKYSLEFTTPFTYINNPGYINYLKYNQKILNTNGTITNNYTNAREIEVEANNKYLVYTDYSRVSQGNLSDYQTFLRFNNTTIIYQFNTIEKTIYDATENGTLTFGYAIYQNYGDQVEFNINIINLTEMFGEGYEPTITEFFNYNIITLPTNYINEEIIEFKYNQQISENYKIDFTIWGNIKDLIINNLQIQDNPIIDIIITYTILWFIMFVIWHMLYLFFDMLIHLFIDWGHKEKEKING